MTQIFDPKPTLKQALQYWMNQAEIANAKVASLEKAITIICESDTLHGLKAASAPVAKPEATKQASAPLALETLAMPPAKTASATKVRRHVVTPTTEQELPRTHAEWFYSVVTRKKQTRAELVNATVAKALSEMGEKELHPENLKKLKDRMYFFMKRGSELGLLKMDGKAPDTTFSK